MSETPTQKDAQNTAASGRLNSVVRRRWPNAPAGYGVRKETLVKRRLQEVEARIRELTTELERCLKVDEETVEMIAEYLKEKGRLIYGNIVNVEQIQAGIIMITDESKDGHYKEHIQVNTLDVLSWVFKKPYDRDWERSSNII